MTEATGLGELKNYGLGILQCTAELLANFTDVSSIHDARLIELEALLKFPPEFKLIAIRDIRSVYHRDLFELFVVPPKIPIKGQPHALLATLTEGEEHINIRLYKEWQSLPL